MADNLSKAGWSLGWVSTLDLQGRTIWIVDAHCYGKRFIMRAEEILTAFCELERAVCIHLLSEQCWTTSRRREAVRCARRWNTDCVSGTRIGHNTVDSHDQSCWLRGRQFLQSKTQRTPSTKTIITLSKPQRRITMQYQILLAALSVMVLYVLMIVGCLCYIGRHGCRAS